MQKYFKFCFNLENKRFGLLGPPLCLVHCCADLCSYSTGSELRSPFQWSSPGLYSHLASIPCLTPVQVSGCTVYFTCSWCCYCTYFWFYFCPWKKVPLTVTGFWWFWEVRNLLTEYGSQMYFYMLFMLLWFGQLQFGPKTKKTSILDKLSFKLWFWRTPLQYMLVKNISTWYLHFFAF